jgi:hypothetical protein
LASFTKIKANQATILILTSIIFNQILKAGAISAHTQIPHRSYEIKKLIFSALFALSSLVLFSACSQSNGGKVADKKAGDTSAKAKGEEADTLSIVKSTYPPTDKALYDSLLKFNAHTDTSGRWPVKNHLTQWVALFCRLNVW